MIQSKEDLKEYLRRDMDFYHNLSKKDRLLCRLLNDPLWQITRYLRFLRKEEYHFNNRHRLMSMWMHRRKNTLGNRLGFKIPRNCFGPGLTIYHHGQVIINEGARIGANCRLHGGNCIGNNGLTQAVPQIGDGLDLGIGACVIGDVKLGNDIKVGANAVVVRSAEQNGVTLVGIPARVK